MGYGQVTQGLITDGLYFVVVPEWINISQI